MCCSGTSDVLTWVMEVTQYVYSIKYIPCVCAHIFLCLVLCSLYHRFLVDPCDQYHPHSSRLLHWHWEYRVTICSKNKKDIQCYRKTSRVSPLKPEYRALFDNVTISCWSDLVDYAYTSYPTNGKQVPETNEVPEISFDEDVLTHCKLLHSPVVINHVDNGSR